MRKVICWFLVIGLMIVFFTGCGSKETVNETKQTDIYVFMAASLKNSMEEIKALYKEIDPNVDIIFNAESSGTLQTQIEEGAECDVFFSAATKQMKELEEKGLVEEDTVKNLLENEVVLIKPAGGKTSVTGFEDITNAENIALAGEDAPVGTYAREILKSLGILEDVMTMEINEGTNVTAVLAAVSEQSNEIGVVYKTDAASFGNKMEIIAAAPEGSMEQPAIYPVGQIINEDAGSEEKEAAKAFIEFLATDEALHIFEDYGFTIYKE